ncbi:MBL fold metallo-hydrolase [Lacisediminihabitans sp.]|uniref:MBL fold metallo-hydrolase n=1 Tax=Lacisediminihabitans sp. TaxID=2787631 RepID=UPI00374D95DB
MTSARNALSLTEAAPGVFFARGPSVNWVVLTEGDSVTLIDTGYPRNAELVDETLEAVAQRTGARSLEAILLTHGHSDHIGNVGRLVARSARAPRVLSAPAEVAHVRRAVLHQVGIPDILRHAYNPRIVAWAVHAVRQGGLEPVGYEGVEALELDLPLDLPGHPVALAVAGHTPGHTVFHLPQHGIVVTGDALVTGHPTVRRTGPQVLHPIFNDDDALTPKNLSVLFGLGAERFLPGHGPLGVMPVALVR